MSKIIINNDYVLVGIRTTYLMNKFPNINKSMNKTFKQRLDNSLEIEANFSKGKQNL